MTFQPIVPLAGYSGWVFLQRTLESQQTAFQESQGVTRLTDYFRDNIGKVQTAADLVNDRQMLEVALGAFGLDEDVNNKFFIQKILEDGTTEDTALANRLADPRYSDFSASFGFGDFGIPLTSQPLFAEDIIDRFEKKQFEVAVGDQNNDFRLALNIESGIDDITSSVESENAQWFGLLGNQPLRQVVQTALGLPSQIASIDLDQQLEVFKERSESIFGTDKVSGFNNAEVQDKMIRLFLIRSSANDSSAFSSGNVALTLLRGG